MNLTKFAIVFVIISLPFYFISDLGIRQIAHAKMLRDQYETIINNAIDDGTMALKLYTEESHDDASRKDIDVDVEEVVNAFLESYHRGFNTGSELDEIHVDRYILALIVVVYDGYYIYGTKEVEDMVSGDTHYRQLLSDKKAFLYRDGDYSIRMTLDDYVTVLNTDPLATIPWQSVQGLITDLKS